jgi:hypothetical protein
MTTEVGPLEVGEIKAVVFDFSNELGVGVVPIAPAVTCVVVEGVDPTPSNVLSGAPNISGQTAVQLVAGGVVGCRYKLRAYVSDAYGERHGITAYLRVVNG